MKSLVVLVICLALTVNLGAGQPATYGYPCNVDNCQVCSYTNFCGLCNNNYMLQFNSSTSQFACLPVTCNVANCANCYQNNICATCNSGFYVAANGSCLSGNSPYTCSSKCLSCNSTQCLLCPFGYNLQNGGCFPNNGNGPMLANCQAALNGYACQLCAPNYIVNPAYQCISNPGFNCPISNCLRCSQSSGQTICAACLNGY